MLNLDALGDEGDDDGAEDNSAGNTDSLEEGSQGDKSGDGSDAKVVSLEDFLKDNPDAQKEHETRIQAESDRRFENRRRRDAADARRTSQREDAAAASRERTELADEGKFEELGKRAASDDENKKAFDDAAQDVAGYIEQSIRDNPQVADVLDADKLAEITAEVRKEGGDVTSFISKISDALAEARVEKAMGDQTENIKTEVAAALKAAGVESRSENADEGADEEVSRSSGASGTARGIDKARDDYIDGKIGLVAIEKAEEAHEASLNN